MYSRRHDHERHDHERHDHERHDHERHWEVHPSLLTHLIHLLRTYVNLSHKVSKRFKVEFYFQSLFSNRTHLKVLQVQKCIFINEK